MWVSGSTSSFEAKARDLIRSRTIIDRKLPRLASLTEGHKAALHYEQTRRDQLDADVSRLLADVFLQGAVYFRARRLDTQRFGSGFAAVLKGCAEEVLPGLFQHFVDVPITESELKQLLQPSLVGVTQKFFSEGLGLLEHDSGKVISTCKGDVPTRIREYLDAENGASGAALLQRFGGPPFGYAPDVVRACVLGLLRAQQCRILPQAGERITSFKDPGVQDLFSKDRDFRNATIEPATDPVIKGADRVKIRKFFEQCTGLELEPDNEALADATFLHLHRFAQQHLELQERLQKLRPLTPELPPALASLEATLSKCLQSRQIEPTLVAVKKHLDTLRDAIQHLGIYRNDLTDECIAEVRRAHRLQTVELDQLQQLGPDPQLEKLQGSVTDQLSLPCPWRDIFSLRPTLESIEKRYRQTRSELLEKQEAEIERLLEEVKLREGFSKLKPDEADSVLRLIRDKRLQTTPDAISPPLIVLRDSVPLRLQEGAAQAHQRLEDVLSESGVVQVIPIRILDSHPRELGSIEEVDLFLKELRERLLGQLHGNARIRLL